MENTSRHVPDFSARAAASFAIVEKLEERLKEKGEGIFISRHEILGMIVEEIDELTFAVQRGQLADVKRECLDIAVAALWALVSLESGKMDW